MVSTNIFARVNYCISKKGNRYEKVKKKKFGNGESAVLFRLWFKVICEVGNRIWELRWNTWNVINYIRRGRRDEFRGRKIDQEERV